MSGWPAEMRATVAVALTSRFPIVLWLGAEELFLVYNDTYIPMLGDKHPAALGQPGRRVVGRLGSDWADACRRRGDRSRNLVR